MAHPLILVPRGRWSPREVLETLRFKPKRIAVPWVDELLNKRFGCVIVCQPCAWKYGDALKRHSYRRDPEFLAEARCDFSGRPGGCLGAGRHWMYYAEEKFKRLRSTQADRQEEFKRSVGVVAGGFVHYPNGRRQSLWKS